MDVKAQCFHSCSVQVSPVCRPVLCRAPSYSRCRPQKSTVGLANTTPVAPLHLQFKSTAPVNGARIVSTSAAAAADGAGASQPEEPQGLFVKKVAGELSSSNLLLSFKQTEKAVQAPGSFVCWGTAALCSRRPTSTCSSLCHLRQPLTVNHHMA